MVYFMPLSGSTSKVLCQLVDLTNFKFLLIRQPIRGSKKLSRTSFSLVSCVVSTPLVCLRVRPVPRSKPFLHMRLARVFLGFLSVRFGSLILTRTFFTPTVRRPALSHVFSFTRLPCKVRVLASRERVFSSCLEHTPCLDNSEAFDNGQTHLHLIFRITKL